MSLFFAILFVYVHTGTAQELFPGQSGQQLRDNIVLSYKPSSVLSYNAARDSMFARVYNVNDSVYCVYTGFPIYIDPTSTTLPRTQANNQGVNTEHTWPQSKGASSGLPNSDLHHLFPTRADVNSSRSNYPFAAIPAPAVTRWWYMDVNSTQPPASQIELWSRTNSSLPRFEPRDDHKGRTARAMFYFYTMYEQEADAADPDYFDIQRTVLYEWHRDFPPDADEMAATNLIGSYQGNRPNPYVLDTSLVRRAFFEDGPPVATFDGIFTFEGYSSTEPCPEYLPAPYDFATTGSDDVVFSAFERVGTECQPVNDAFNSRNWATTSSLHAGHYVTFSVAPKTHRHLQFSSSDFLQFYSRRSSTGPQQGAIHYRIDGGSFVPLHTWQPTTGGGNQLVRLPDIPTASHIEFRFYGWNATGSSGTLRYANVYITGATGTDTPLSVQFVDFDYVRHGTDLTLRWTADAAENSVFTVERAQGGSNEFISVASVQSRDGVRNYTHTLHDQPAGRHQFRLSSRDRDGVVSFSPVIEVEIELPVAYSLSGPYPNPFNPSTSVTVTVARNEQVNIALYDALGRRVTVVHNGPVNANEPAQFAIDGTTLPSGLYLLRVTGESFSTTRPLTLIK